MTTENTDVKSEVVAPSEENPNVAHADQEKNWAAVRQTVQSVKDENAQLKAKLDAIEQASMPKEPTIDDEIRELERLAEEDILSESQEKKLDSLRIRRETRAEAENLYNRWKQEEEEKRKKEELAKLPDRLKAEHRDFDEVVSEKNIEYLKAHKPHLFVTLEATQDLYARARAAYDYCKAFCPSPEIEKEKEAIKQNAARPGSLDAVGRPPTQQADPRRLSATDKQERWERLKSRL